MYKFAVYKSQYDFCRPYIKNFNLGLDISCDVLSWSKIMSQDFKHVKSFDFRDRKEDINQYPNIEFIHSGLDQSPGIKYTKPGVGRIKGSYEPKGSSTMAVNLSTLDSFAFADVGFIKIDCDGYEEKVLRGGHDTIDKSDPVIFCEYNPTRCQSHEYLLSIGYTLMDVWNLRGEPHDGVYVRD